MPQTRDQQVAQAVALHLSGRLEQAETLYRAIVKSDADAFVALKGLGALLLQTGRNEEASSVLSNARRLEPKDLDVLSNLGAASLQCGKLDQARESYEQALSFDPIPLQSLLGLGLVHAKRGDFEASAAAYENAITIDPNNVDAHFNVSRTYRALGLLDEAVNSAQTVVTLSPDYAEGWINLGRTQESKGDYTAAEESKRLALRLDPHSPSAHHNLAQVLLQLGSLQDGWAEFEWRWRTPDFQSAKSLRDLSNWDGDPLKEGTLLVWAEQGIGDEILHSTMIPELKALAPHIMVACTSRLVPLFSRTFAFANVVDQSTLRTGEGLLSNVTAQIAGGSLGQYLRPDFASFRGDVEHLKADAAAVKAQRERYDEMFPGRRRIGVSWHSANPKSGEAKSLPVKGLSLALTPILDREDIALFDLQYGDADADREDLKARTGGELYLDPDIDPMHDLDGFAAQVAAMDLIITVSNTTAHMAGALGVPCWTLLPLGDGLRWYWFLDRNDSPWYPSLRLFRQTTPGDWTTVVQQVHQALKDTLTS